MFFQNFYTPSASAYIYKANISFFHRDKRMHGGN